jgi:hypothetical protein
MDDEQVLMDMIASGRTAAAGHADDIGDATNTDIYLNMSGGDEIDQLQMLMMTRKQTYISEHRSFCSKSYLQ